MTNAFRVIAADVHDVNQKGNNITVSRYRNDVDCTKQILLPAGPQVSSYNNGLGIQLGGGTRIQFMVPTGSTAVDVNNTYLNYQIRFILDTNCTEVPNPQKADGTRTSIPYNFGVFYLYKGFWFFVPYELRYQQGKTLESFIINQVADTSITGQNCGCVYDSQYGYPIFGYLGSQYVAFTAVPNQPTNSSFSWEPITTSDYFAISSGPLNSTCLLYETNVQFSSLNETDQRKFLQWLNYQSMLDPKIQDAQQSTWFYGDEKVVQIPFLPYIIDQVKTSQTYGQRVPDMRCFRETGVTNNSSKWNVVNSVTGARASIQYSFTSLYAPDNETLNANFKTIDFTTGYTQNNLAATPTTANAPIQFISGNQGMEDVFIYPNKATGVSDGHYGVVVNYDFQIPLRFIHTVFDQDNPLLYLNAMGASLFNVFLILQRQNICDIFGNSRMFGSIIGPTAISTSTDGVIANTNLTNYIISRNSKLVQGMTTGISDMYMVLDVKQSNLFNSDLAMAGLIAQRVQKMQWNNLGGIITTDLQERPIMRPLKAQQDVVILVAPNDENASENFYNGCIDDPNVITSSSLYLHQHSTMFSEKQLLSIINQYVDSTAFNYLWDFNLRVGKSPNYMYQPNGIRDLQRFKHETLASNHLVCNREVATMSDMFKYGDNMILTVNTEHFANLYNNTIAFDGTDLTGTQLLLRWSIGTYQPHLSTMTSITPATNYSASGPSLVTNSIPLPTNGIQITVLQYDEEWSIISPTSGKWVLTDDISGYNIEKV